MLQKYDIITADDGRKVPCFYSLDFQASIQQIEENRTIVEDMDVVKERIQNA